MVTEKDLLELRIEGVTNAQDRSRLAFFLTLIVSATIIGALWNEYFSWDIGWAYTQKLTSGSGRDALLMEAIKNWNKSQWVSIPLLGIQVSISDVAIIGSLTMWILTFWYFLSARRENIETATLLQHANLKNDEIKKYVYLGIRRNLVFTIISNVKPISSLKYNKTEFYQSNRYSVLYGMLNYSTFITCILLLLSDLYFLFLFNSPYRELRNKMAYEVITQNELVKLIMMDIFAVVMCILMFYNCKRVVVIEIATSKILRKFFIKHRSILMEA